MGCFLYTLFALELLNKKSKEEAYEYIQNYDYSMFKDETKEYYKRILHHGIRQLNIDDISSSGFVVDTLEAVLWCFLKYNNYENTIIEAINLGNDTDTIGALVG